MDLHDIKMVRVILLSLMPHHNKNQNCCRLNVLLAKSRSLSMNFRYTHKYMWYIIEYIKAKWGIRGHSCICSWDESSNFRMSMLFTEWSSSRLERAKVFFQIFPEVLEKRFFPKSLFQNLSRPFLWKWPILIKKSQNLPPISNLVPQYCTETSAMTIYGH